jgi:glycopeptide antibiotics resistance protein
VTRTWHPPGPQRSPNPPPLTATTGRTAHAHSTARSWSLTRCRLLALFAVYLVLLVWTVLWKLDVPWVGGDTAIKLVPFVRTGAAGPSAPAEVIVNVALFIPFGVYLGLLAPRRRWWTAAVAVAGTSLALEVVQYVLAVGRSDTTDVIANTAGGLAGLGLLVLARRRLGVSTASVMTQVCSIGTVCALLAGGLYLVSPGRVVHVRDIGPLARLDTSGSPGPGAAPQTPRQLPSSRHAVRGQQAHHRDPASVVSVGRRAAC